MNEPYVLFVGLILFVSLFVLSRLINNLRKELLSAYQSRTNAITALAECSEFINYCVQVHFSSENISATNDAEFHDSLSTALEAVNTFMEAEGVAPIDSVIH